MRATSLFVVGAPRSGTTLARHLLRGVQGVYLPPDEFQILAQFIHAAERGASPEELARLVDATVFADHMRRRGIWPGAARLARCLDGASPADAVRALTLELARREGAPPVVLWGDKTPENVFHLDLIDRLWPGGRVLNVVRDPRATVLSMHRSWGRSLVRGAVVWRDAIRAAERFQACAGAGRLRSLSYEDLTQNPEAELAALAAWLDLPFDPGLIARVASEERWGESAGVRGVHKRAPDWERSLSPGQIKGIEEICFDEMTRWGFEPRFATRARRPGAMTLRLARGGDALRVLRAYANERGWRAAVSYKLRQWRGMRRA